MVLGGRERLGEEDLQLVVIGIASIVTFVVLGLLAWLVRAGPEVRERDREWSPNRDRQQ